MIWGDIMVKDIDQIFLKHEHSIIAIIPLYIKNCGESTLIVTKENFTYIVFKNIKTVIKNLMNFHLIDYKALNEKYKKMLSLKRNIPLVVSDEIFFKFKIREKISKNDISYAYLNFNYIKDFKNSNIIFISGEKLLLMCTKKAFIEASYRYFIISKHSIVEKMKKKQSENLNDIKNELYSLKKEIEKLKLKNL